MVINKEAVLEAITNYQVLKVVTMTESHHILAVSIETKNTEKALNTPHIDTSERV